MRLDCLAFSPSLCLSLDVSVHGTTFFSAATQTPSALVVTEEERKENRYLAGQRPTHRGRSMRNSNNGTLTSPFSLERTVAIRCHTFFRKPRQTDMCANLGRRRAEVRELGAGSSTANQCEQELKLCVGACYVFFFFFFMLLCAISLSDVVSLATGMARAIHYFFLTRSTTIAKNHFHLKKCGAYSFFFF